MRGWTVQEIAFTDVEAALSYELDLLVQATALGPQLLIWELNTYAVVLGYSRAEQVDADMTKCAEDHVPVVRRRSGGGTVLLGPGCMCYSLAMPFAGQAHLQDIGSTNRWVLQRVASALSSNCSEVITVSGVSDLTVSDRKIGGSAQRRTRDGVLWHGTLLYDFDLTRIARYLREPDRQPEYRERRRHGEFVRNLPVPRAQLVELLTQTFDAKQELASG